MEEIRKNIFSLPLKVRDYECDSAQGVNNAVYLNYLEFARFEFMRQELKWDPATLTNMNIGFVVARIEVDYRRSLISGEEFVIETSMQRLDKKKFLFTQDIYRLANRKAILNGKVFVTPINTATLRSEVPDALETLLSDKYPVPAKEESTT